MRSSFGAVLVWLLYDYCILLYISLLKTTWKPRAQRGLGVWGLAPNELINYLSYALLSKILQNRGP